MKKSGGCIRAGERNADFMLAFTGWFKAHIRALLWIERTEGVGSALILEDGELAPFRSVAQR